MTAPAGPTPQLVSAVNWFSWAAKVIAIVDQNDGTVGIGQLLSLTYNHTNGRYVVGIGHQTIELMASHMITVAQVTATSTAASLGLPN